MTAAFSTESAIDDDAPDHILRLPAGVLCYIFSFLGPKDLCCVSATCTAWRLLSSKDAAAQRVWRAFYIARWKYAKRGREQPTSWHEQYGSKMHKLRCWSGKYQQDTLYGHKAGVRCIKLLPSHNLLVTGSVDKTVRLWDLQAGMPIISSKLHGGTVRCIAVDSDVLASGCSDKDIKIWLANLTPDTEAALSDASQAAPLFDLAKTNRVLKGHVGPVAALCLTEQMLYSGSWDYTVRMWSRDSWGCTSVLTYDDWVSAVAARGNNILVAAGTDVLVHDVHTGQVVRKFQNLHEGHVTCIEGTENGKLLFTGAADGLVLAHDLRMKDPSVVLWHHNASVQGLAFEDPWLASCSADGSVIMLNTETQRKAVSRALSSNCRQLQAPGPAWCVDIAEQWIACGSEADTVRLWDFTKAQEAAERAAAAKLARNRMRRGRKGTGAAHVAPPAPAPVAPAPAPQHIVVCGAHVQHGGPPLQMHAVPQPHGNMHAVYGHMQRTPQHHPYAAYPIASAADFPGGMSSAPRRYRHCVQTVTYRLPPPPPPPAGSSPSSAAAGAAAWGMRVLQRNRNQ